MSIPEITSGLPAAGKHAGVDIVIPGSKGFADTLTVGQIIKGRVLRHFGSDRYLVEFGGREHVVDSTVPLRTNELIHGRVLGLGERVELQRVRIERPTGAEPSPTQPSPANTVSVSYGRSAQLVQDVLANFNVVLSDEARAAITAAARAVSEPTLMARVAVALNRLGLPQAPALLRGVYAAATRDGELSTILAGRRDAPQLVASRQSSSEEMASAITMLAAALQHQLEDVSNRRGGSIESLRTSPPADDADRSAEVPPAGQNVTEQHGERAGYRETEPARWVLNSQTGGLVSHHVSTLSLLLGDRLVEVDVALFDQQETPAATPTTRHRQVVLSLVLSELGRVNITARVVGDHVRLHVATETDAATEALAGYMGELRQDVSGAGWQLDELAYETLMQCAPNAPVRSVIEHFVTQDSLSRLM